MRVPLLQRYVFLEVLRVFLFVLSCLTVLLIFVGVFQQASERGLGPLQLLQILPYVVPSLLPFAIPAALLLTVSLVYGRLAGDQEITAAKSAGINVLTLLWPSFFLGGVLSVLSLVLSDQAIPWATRNIERTIVTAMEDIILDRLRTERQFSDRFRGIYVSVAGVDGRRLVRPMFRYMTRGRQPATLVAQEATIDLDLASQQVLIHLKNGVLDLPNNGRAYLNGERTEEIEWRAIDTQVKPLQLPIVQIQRELVRTVARRRDGQDRAAVEAAMAITLGDFERLLAPSAAERRADKLLQSDFHKLRTEVHSRYALACSCFFFVLVGSPLAVLKAKARFLTSFLYCFVPITVGYYPLVLGLVSQCKRGHIDPLWAMWVGNAVLALVAWALLRRVIRF
jgi:lipopolysaccharide export system permease protein